MLDPLCLHENLDVLVQDPWLAKLHSKGSNDYYEKY